MKKEGDVPIRIMIVDDHRLIRKGLRALIDSTPGYEVIAEADNGAQAVQLALEIKPDIVLMDLAMPGGDGIEATAAIRQQNEAIRILIVTSFSDEKQVFAAIKAGAHGYLLKDSSPEQLLQAIQTTHRGESTLHPLIASMVIQELKNPTPASKTTHLLTDQENKVLRLIATGMTNREIAAKLTLSERTITTHVSNILGKLHLANRTQAALYALRKGLADLD
jgi:NarL family two-component system response regulator LiaR